MTRLYQHLVIRLMPPRLLNAMHVVYEECAETCNDRTQPPFIHCIETFSFWLRVAHETGWRPPRRTIPLGDQGMISGIDDGSNPSWSKDSVRLFEELS